MIGDRPPENPPSEPSRALRKILTALFISQSLYSAAMIVAFTVGAVLIVQLADGDSRWTGVPSTLRLIGAALFAYPMGRLMDRLGRRPGLVMGHLIGLVGALIAGLAVILASMNLFLVGAFMIGMAKGTLDQGRYAAAEASPLDRRARSLSIVVFGASIGSILGPAIISSANEIGMNLRVPDLGGPWFVAAIFFALSLLVTFIGLRPDPKALSLQFSDDREIAAPESREGRSFRELFQDPRMGLAVAAMVFGQMAMVLVMTVTPIHMRISGNAIGVISGVITAHTLGMFGLSYVTGWLVDRFGRATMIIIGGVLLTAACVFAPLGSSIPWLSLSLFLLGLGWNFCFVAGSTLLNDILQPHERGRIQGINEALINVASGAGSIGSGFVFSSLGFSAMSWATVMITLIPLLWALRWTAQRRTLATQNITFDKNP